MKRRLMRFFNVELYLTVITIICLTLTMYANKRYGYKIRVEHYNLELYNDVNLYIPCENK